MSEEYLVIPKSKEVFMVMVNSKEHRRFFEGETGESKWVITVAITTH